MRNWLRTFLTMRRDLYGELTCLRDREADPALSAIPGAPPAVSERVLDLVCEAFDVPASQRHCLRPSDSLRWLYLGGLTTRRWFDDWEFEELLMDLETSTKRQLSEKEMKTIDDGTVGDLAHYFEIDCPT